MAPISGMFAADRVERARRYQKSLLRLAASRTEQTSALLSLPEEMLLSIVENLSHPKDLKSLRQTCTEMLEIANTKLYREVVTDMKNSRRNLIYSAGHSGHRHVRSLTFKYTGPENMHDKDNIRRSMAQLLKLLPINQLRMIKMPLTVPLYLEFMHELARNQKALTHLDLGPMDGSYSEMSGNYPELTPWPTTLRTFELAGYFSNFRDFDDYSQIIHDSTKLENLIVRANSSVTTRNPLLFQMHGLHDTAVMNGLVSGMWLGSKGDSVSPQIPMKLKLFTLEHVSLVWAKRTFLKIIDFGHLKFLNIFECTGSITLLDSLRNSFSKDGCNLKGFTLTQRQPELTDSAILESFLMILSGLTCLTIDVWGWLGEPFDLYCLHKHAPTLERLCLGVGSANQPP